MASDLIAECSSAVISDRGHNFRFFTRHFPKLGAREKPRLTGFDQDSPYWKVNEWDTIKSACTYIWTVQVLFIQRECLKHRMPACTCLTMNPSRSHSKPLNIFFCSDARPNIRAQLPTPTPHLTLQFSLAPAIYAKSLGFESQQQQKQRTEHYYAMTRGARSQMKSASI